MDLKQEAARTAFTLIANNTSVGLGDGRTIKWLASYLIEGINSGLNVKLYSSSIQTQQYLQVAGIPIVDISLTDSLDQYFDGCDQIDEHLDVLKSGAGIHTQEKLFSSMAKKFIILAESSKFVSRFDPKFPLVVEALPQAVKFIFKEMKKSFPAASFSLRISEFLKKPVITRNGNYLIDCFFTEWPESGYVNAECKSITGIVEISLFHKMVHEAIIAGNTGIQKYDRKAICLP